jgi:hypothetical protein
VLKKVICKKCIKKDKEIEKLKREIKYLYGCLTGDIDGEDECCEELRNEFDHKYFPYG